MDNVPRHSREGGNPQNLGAVAQIVLAAAFASLVYIMGLWSLYAPSNGDEMVYLHIARLTHEAGQWLPLVSDLQTPAGTEMRNTKPPLLFWQAMWAGDVFGWDLFALRLPYVLQTLLCAAVVGWLTYTLSSPRTGGCHEVTGGKTSASERLSCEPSSWALKGPPPALRVRPPLGGHLGVGILAAFLYLGFFSTYRYGRPALPSSTESLFLFGIVAIVVTKLDWWLERPWRLGAMAGVMMIPALLVKSFVLVVPVGLWLFLLAASQTIRVRSQLPQSEVRGNWTKTRYSVTLIGLAADAIRALKAPTLATLIGLAGFCLWFALDPNPQAVWREFIIGENFSTKFSEQRADSLLAIWLAPLLNAGLLAPLIVGLSLAAWRGRSSMTLAHKALWLWVVAWLLVFSLPSQRSARYVIPLMPALAVLLAMSAQEIAAKWWRMTLGLIAIGTVVLLHVALQLDPVFDFGQGYWLVYFLFLGLMLALCVWALKPNAMRVGAAILSMVWLLLLGGLCAPFDRGQGQFQATVEGLVRVPSNFNASWEKYRFVIKGASQVTPDNTMSPENKTSLLVLSAPINANHYPLELETLCEEHVICETIESRLVLRNRHQSSEFTWDAFKNMAPLLVERESLIKISPRIQAP